VKLKRERMLKLKRKVGEMRKMEEEGDEGQGKEAESES
jgi:hypothetical protein